MSEVGKGLSQVKGARVVWQAGRMGVRERMWVCMMQKVKSVRFEVILEASCLQEVFESGCDFTKFLDVLKSVTTKIFCKNPFTRVQLEYLIDFLQMLVSENASKSIAKIIPCRNLRKIELILTPE
mmetsp:Transcript_22175/g.25476  ORF Transcript_22175/g.25476 Transcript_22175/m.25476 type:complete len:125 (+) Transcript_22175:1130-1504(+)